MSKKSLSVNTLLNVIKTSLSILFPLITYPYALKVLGVEKMGAITYVNSIVAYFSLFAMLGVSTYAIREGAKVREDKAQFSSFVNQVFTINIITTITALIMLLVIINLVPQFNGYAILFTVLGCNIWLTTIGVDWINVIYEDYVFITIRSIITYIIFSVFLFIFVKNEQDYVVYAMLQVLSNGIICISNWVYCRKYTRIKIVRQPHLKKHLPRLVVLFANSLAVSIYVNFDTTMLGWMKGEYEVGLYAVSTRIYSIIKSIMIAVYSVSIPRLATYYGQKKIDDFKKLYTQLWCCFAVLLIPAGIGMLCVARDIVYIFGGESYLPSASALEVLSIALIFSIFGGLVTSCLNVTIHREKENLIATLASSIINCGLNLVFIPAFSYTGAAVTTLIAEVFVLVYCYVRVPRMNTYLDFAVVKKNLIQALIASAPIIIVSCVANHMIENIVLRLAIIIICSALLYIIIQLIQKNDIIKSICNRSFELS